MWQLIRTLEIPKSSEILWDVLKYFHLKSNAVYSSFAKNNVSLNLPSIIFDIDYVKL